MRYCITSLYLLASTAITVGAWAQTEPGYLPTQVLTTGNPSMPQFLRLRPRHSWEANILATWFDTRLIKSQLNTHLLMERLGFARDSRERFPGNLSIWAPKRGGKVENEASDLWPTRTAPHPFRRESSPYREAESSSRGDSETPSCTLFLWR